MDDRLPSTDEIIAVVLGKEVCQTPSGVVYINANQRYKTFIVLRHRLDGKSYRQSCGHTVLYLEPYAWFPDTGVVLDLPCAEKVEEGAYGQACFLAVAKIVCRCDDCRLALWSPQEGWLRRAANHVQTIR